MFLKKFLKFKFNKKYSRSLNCTFEKEYFFGDLKIILKGNHMLQTYQNLFPLYDRFLPVLCKDFNGLIIDVGANIGDTSIAIFSKNYNSFIVGVEPDNIFFYDCLNNIKRNELDRRFLGINKFITTKRGVYSVEKTDSCSTGSICLEPNEVGEINTISFSELMDLIPSENKVKFELLKIDTDGFDWDVINSFNEYLNTSVLKPRFVFFEMQTYSNNNGFNDEDRESNLNKYILAITSLFEKGYQNFCLFDNFGTPIKMTKSINDIGEINDYLKRSQIYNKYPTIYYVDILAFSDEELEYVNNSISNLYTEINKIQ